MRILGITEDISYVAGGRLAFLKLMKALALRGNEALVISSSGATEVYNPSPVTIRRLGTARASIVGLLIFYARLLFNLPGNAIRSNVIVVNSGYTLPIVLTIAKLLRKPVVVLQHDALSLDYLQSTTSSNVRQFLAIVRWILIYPPLRLADGILCISSKTLVDLRRMGITNSAQVIGNVVT